MNKDRFKRAAAARAVAEVSSGMILGLGAGSTALMALEELGRLIAAGRLADVVGVPCSDQVAADAARLGVPLTSLEEHPVIDLTIDGADEVDEDLNLIKGGGGALLREKIVAQASRREIIIVDESKLSPRLGLRWPLPVEVLPFGLASQEAFLKSLGAAVKRRLDAEGRPFRTDSSNFILDAAFGPIADPAALSRRLDARAGIVEHGLFVGLADEVVVAGQGGVRILKAAPGAARPEG